LVLLGSCELVIEDQWSSALRKVDTLKLSGDRTDYDILGKSLVGSNISTIGLYSMTCNAELLLAVSQLQKLTNITIETHEKQVAATYADLAKEVSKRQRLEMVQLVSYSCLGTNSFLDALHVDIKLLCLKNSNVDWDVCCAALESCNVRVFSLSECFQGDSVKLITQSIRNWNVTHVRILSCSTANGSKDYSELLSSASTNERIKHISFSSTDDRQFRDMLLTFSFVTGDKLVVDVGDFGNIFGSKSYEA
jgi:hypothetical protein